VLSARISEEMNGHSKFLVPLIHEVFAMEQIKASQLDAVSVSIGPGSYTGLRVGLSTAKAICHTAGIPLIAISTLDSLISASEVVDDNPLLRVVTVLDARRNDAYAAIFDGVGHRIAEDQCMSVDPGCLDAWVSPEHSVVFCGEGVGKWLDCFGDSERYRYVPAECHATHLVQKAWKMFEKQDFADFRSVVPRYLKPPNITAQPVIH
jgi:tRNA threonylcarbamoyladenosine biosynthesis protein TsaB